MKNSIWSVLVLLMIGSNAGFAGENKDVLDNSTPGKVQRTFSIKNVAIGAYETYWFGQNFHPNRIAESEKRLAELKKIAEDGKTQIKLLDPKIQKLNPRTDAEDLLKIYKYGRPFFKLINATMALDGLARFTSGLTSDSAVGWFALDDLAGAISEKVTDSVNAKVNPKQEATRDLADESTPDAAVR